MNCLFLMTTEWSKRLLTYVTAKLDIKEYTVFDKNDDFTALDKPDVVITACSHIDIDKAIIHFLQSPSVLVVEGLNNWRYSQGNYVTSVCVWGENMKRDFIRGGWDEKKLIVTGCPRFEEHKRRALIALPAYSKAELDSERIIESLTQALEVENIIPVVKRHPGISNEKDDVLNYIRDCDIVITGASTVALHALLMSKQVVYYDTPVRLFNREQHFAPLVKSGIHICTTIEGIINQIRHSNVVTDYLYDSYGATDKIIHVIKRYIK